VSSKKKHEKIFLFCPECGISISSRRILNEGKVRLRYVFCPECGKKIDFANYMTEASLNVKSTDKKDFEDKLDKALDIIINDRDFSQSFKNILHHFIVRLSYVKLKEVEKEKKTPISQMLLTTELIDLIQDRLSPIINKKPILSFLKYLDQSDYPEFFLDLKRYQIKLRKNKKYRKAYSIYVQWLIGIVYRIINQINIEKGLYEYQKTIRDDLVKFFELEKNHEEKSKDKEMTNDLEKIKKKIKKIDWEDVSDDWVVDKLINKFTKVTKLIKLNPYKDCNKDSNPLYMHKGWLENLYNGLDLSDRKIGEICGIDHWTIGDWRKRHKIETRETKGYYINKQGYKLILMPLDYNHPRRKPTSSGKQWILEHRLVIENFLRHNPHLEASKKYLIEGKYLKSGTEVHHINQDRLDNRIENLWLYTTKKAHSLAQEDLNQCFSALIKLKQVTFNNGEYTYDDSFDYRIRYDVREIREITKPLEFRLPFENINEIKDEIKKWDWGEISDNWIVYKYRGGDKQSKKSYIEYKLNPYKDCDKDSNPLYMHKRWLEKVATDKRFNLTDSRLSKLCGIPISTVQHWKQRTHKISTKYTKKGAPKYVDPYGYIVIKVPDTYKNPFVKIMKDQRIAYNIIHEHRYIAERNLAKSSNLELKNKYLLDGKYLQPEYHVHHINLDILDNRIENLWITNEHSKIHSSLRSLTKQLLDSGFLEFDNGRYYL